MITTTMGALVDAEAALARLSADRLPVKTAYHLAKLARLVRQETAHFHEARQQAVIEYGLERDATPAELVQFGPRVITVRPEHADAFTARLLELRALPVDLDWRPVTLAALDGITVAAADLDALGPLLEEGPP